jgi:hypothetical protein
MAIFPVRTLTRDQVKLRWGERYTSEGLNMKFLGIPNGVYLGFVPSSVAASNILTLAIDPSFGVSSLRVKSSLGPYSVDLFLEENIEIDFTFHAVFPVYVYAKADFRVNLETSAEIRTRTTPPNGIDEVGICRIDALGAAPVIDFGQAPDRHAPIANTGIPFGFMTGGAEQDRVRAVATSDEVDLARIDTIAFLHPTLAARLTADFAPLRIAENQGREISTLRSNDRTEVTGNSINISHSFATTSRTSQPAQDISGGGSETLNGAICEVTNNIDPATSDLIRNIVAIQEIASARPYVDPSTGRPVFGRLKFDEVDATAGTIPDPTTTLTFTNGLNTVLRTAGLTDLDTVYSPGDLVKDPDGNYYPVSSVLPTAMTLSVPWVAATLLVTQTIQRRRFTVEFFTRNLGVETAYSVVRTCIVDSSGLSWTGPGLGLVAPDTPEDYITSGASVGNSPQGIVAQTYALGNVILYVPDDPAVVIGTGETITGSGGSIATAVLGTPTVDAPDLRFFFNVFQDISESRSNELLDYLQSPHPEVPRATEIIDGLTRFAPDGGTSRKTALQASDTRIFGNIIAEQSMVLQKITDLGAPTPATNDAARIVDVEAATHGFSQIQLDCITSVANVLQWVSVGPNVPAIGGGGWGLAAGVITVPVGQGGDYWVYVKTEWNLAGIGTGLVELDLRVNGIQVATGRSGNNSAAPGTVPHPVTIGKLLSLLPGDTLDVFIVSLTFGNFSTNIDTNLFSAFRIR